MAAAEEKISPSRSQPSQGLETPFLDQEFFTGQREEEWQAHLGELEAENSFLSAFEQAWAQLSIGETESAERSEDKLLSPDEAQLEEQWDNEEFYDERAPDEFLAEEEEEGALDWEVIEAEEGAEIPGAIEQFAARLASERARHSGRAVSDEESALLQDYRDTLAGGRARWGKLYGKAPLTVEAIGRAWMISREGETRFRYSSSPVRPLQGFAPPGERVTLIQHPLVGSSNKAPVAAVVGRFAEELKRRYPGMRAENYRGHGGGSFAGRGYSLDLYISGKDDRGFFRPHDALAFLRAVHEAAAAVNAQWRVIYNDFSVADVMNRTTGQRNVIFVGTVFRDRNRHIKGLNWHGPDPLILHFHLDLAPGAGTHPPPGPLPPPAPLPSPRAPRQPATAKPAAELVRFAQRVLNVAEGERLAVDGDLGPLTRGALERFRRRHNLGAGGVLDAKTELALAQRALEELAQQSLFQIGAHDAKTEQALRNFKAERGLTPNAALDAATRAALADAIERRAGLRPRTAVPTQVTDWARVPAEQRMARVMKLLVEKYGYPMNSAAGIVGNLWEESGLLPNRIEGSNAATPMRARNFSNVVTDFTAEQVMNRDAAASRGPLKPGIGFAQWTSADRRAGLFSHSFEGRVLGAAILENLDAQVDYLVSELRLHYSRVDALLRNPGTSLEAASDEMVYSFEVPASVLTPPGQGPRRRLPREHASVQAIFQRRRASSQRALQAYRGAQQEACAPDEEAEEEQAMDFESPLEEAFDVQKEQGVADGVPQRAAETEANLDRQLVSGENREVAPAEEAEDEDLDTQLLAEAEREAEDEEEFEIDEEAEGSPEAGELDPALLDIAERTMAREEPEFEELASKPWTTCFSAADVARLKTVYQDNDTAAQANSDDRCSCIVMLNVGLGQLLSLPAKSHPARGGSTRTVDMAQLTTESIDKAMTTLVKGGYATGPTVMNFYDRRNRTAGTLKPVKLKKSVQAKVVSIASTKGCWFAIGLSIMDGYHSVLLLVDRTSTPAKIFWLDQFSADVTDDVTSSLDQRITDKTQAWWQAVIDSKGKGYNTTIRLWRLRKRRKKS